MSGRIRLWGAALLSLAGAIASSGQVLAQEPGADGLPSETPPPPPVPPEEPPAAPIAETPPAAPPLRPVMTGATEGEPPKMDITLPLSLTSLAVGGAFLLSGGITLAAAPGPEEYCTVSGCVDRQPGRELLNIGADLLGAGAGFAVVGGIGMLAWANSRPRGAERRNSEPMLGVGFSMTAFGAAGFGLGLAQTLTYARDEVDPSTGWPLFVTSGLLLAGGIPLWTAGANNRDGAERAQIAKRDQLLADPRVTKQRRSTGMVIGGSILTGLGGLGGLAGTGVFIADTVAGGPSFLSVVVALPSLGVGALVTSIGVPLILVGNRQVIEGENKASTLLPEVTAGPSGLAASWSLE